MKLDHFTSPSTSPYKGVVQSSALLFVFVLASFAVPIRSLAQERSRTRFLRWSYQDIASVATSTRPRDGLYVLGGLAIIGGVTLLDKQINHEVEEGYKGAFASYVNVANELGGPNATFPVIGVFTVSLFTNNVRFQDAAFTSLEALAYSEALNAGVKYVVGRVRPEDTNNPHRFKPFSGQSSFPSGHTNSAFAILTPWALYYPHPVSYVLLAVGAGGTGLARISKEKHWASDVIAGGLQGFLTAYWLTRRHKLLQERVRRAAPQVSFIPTMDTDAAGFVINITF